jgi:hypothetical protein
LLRTPRPITDQNTTTNTTLFTNTTHQDDDKTQFLAERKQIRTTFSLFDRDGKGMVVKEEIGRCCGNRQTVVLRWAVCVCVVGETPCAQ